MRKNHVSVWRKKLIQTDQLNDGQLILVCFSETEVYVFEWSKKYSSFYNADKGGDLFTAEQIKQKTLMWAFFNLPKEEN